MVEFLGIHWAGASKIIFFPLVIFIIFFIVRNYFKNKKIISTLVHQNNQKIILKNYSQNTILLKTILLSLAVILIFIALLQPQWSKKDITVQQEGRDLLIALDISKSMLAKDLKPNRLEFMKLKIRNLLKKLDFERVGLILFSGSAFLQCPLTVDHNAFLMFLNQVDVESIASGTTAIDTAISKALDVFALNKGQKNKLLLLITDGEDFSLNLNNVKKKAQKENIKVFTFGVGTLEGAPIPILNEYGKAIGHEVDEKGQIALSKLNEKILLNIANQFLGKYFKATYDNSDLNKIVNIIKSYEKEKFEEKQISYYQDRYPWFLAVAWILLALEWIL